jgi:hypothetical protein
MLSRSSPFSPSLSVPEYGSCAAATRTWSFRFVRRWFRWCPSSASALYLMIKLPLLTWEVLIIWLVIGLMIYFTYSIKHSKVQAMSPAETTGRSR